MNDQYLKSKHEWYWDAEVIHLLSVSITSHFLACLTNGGFLYVYTVMWTLFGLYPPLEREVLV